jgi:hypothetical protein
MRRCRVKMVKSYQYGQKVFTEEPETSSRMMADLAPEMYKALRGLFDNCQMIHTHWGDNNNAREANAAIATARDILSRIEEVTR